MQILLENIHTRRSSQIDVDRPGDAIRVDQIVEQLISGTHTVADVDAAVVDRLVREAEQLVTIGLHGTFFRGRYDDGTQLRSTQFGPAPVSASAARYKLPNEVVWYAAWNERTVHAELGKSRAIWVQSFLIDAPNVRVLRALPHDSKDASAFHHLLTKSESHDANSYRASLLVREIAARLAVDVMEYPSVRLPYHADREGVNVIAWGDAAQELSAVPHGAPARLP